MNLQTRHSSGSRSPECVGRRIIERKLPRSVPGFLPFEIRDWRRINGKSALTLIHQRFQLQMSMRRRNILLGIYRIS